MYSDPALCRTGRDWGAGQQTDPLASGPAQSRHRLASLRVLTGEYLQRRRLSRERTQIQNEERENAASPLRKAVRVKRYSKSEKGG